jgi:Peroxisomal membrane protein 24.
MLALAKLAVQPNMHPLSSLITSDSRTKITNNAYPVFAGMTWAMVMYIFRWHPETLASSLRSSMVYMYVLLPPPTIYDSASLSVLRKFGVAFPNANLHLNHSYGDSDHWDSLRTLLVHNK